MLNIQIESLSGDKYDIEIPVGTTVSSTLYELAKKYHVDTSRCYLCHNNQELENSNPITNELISHDSKFILYNYAMFPEKSFPRVDDAFSFSLSRYSDKFVRESPSLSLFRNNQVDEEQLYDENGQAFHREIYIPSYGLSGQSLIDQLGEFFQNGVPPNALAQLLNMYRNSSTISNAHDNYSDSEEEDNENDASNLPDFEDNNENDNSNVDDELYDNDNYNDGDNYNENGNYLNIDFNNLNQIVYDENGSNLDGIRLVFDQDPDDREFINDGEDHNDDLFLVENDDISENPNNEEEAENEADIIDQSDNPEANIEDVANNEENLAENNPDNNDDEDQTGSMLLNQMAEAGMPVQNVDLNDHDNEVISRITNYGYDPMLVLQVYLACDKDEETTTACLMSM